MDWDELLPGVIVTCPAYSPGFNGDMGMQEYGVSAGFVVGPGSPLQDFGGEYTIEMVDGCGRVVKKRTCANKKERRTSMSINNAFAELRDCIPNVPADTKLSKIKTLRLATSYIAYLMDVLHQEPKSEEASAAEGRNSGTKEFKADMKATKHKMSQEIEKVIFNR